MIRKVPTANKQQQLTICSATGKFILLYVINIDFGIPSMIFTASNYIEGDRTGAGNLRDLITRLLDAQYILLLYYSGK